MAIQPKRVVYIDPARQRQIPVALYMPRTIGSRISPMIFSPGYDKHREANAHAYTDYGYLCGILAEKGIFTASVQHDLPDDPLLPMVRPYRQTRMADWLESEANILCIIAKLKVLYPALDWSRLILAGHSNGGDISALACTHHPGLADTLITLDNRRMPLPRSGVRRVLTLRGCDFAADAGVLPSEEERCRRVTVLPMNGIRHSDMGASGTDAQHAAVTKAVLGWLGL